MKYIEAEKAIEALSSKYSVNELWEYFAVNCKDTEIACVGSNERYVYAIRNKCYFQKLPFSNKLYMIMSELAMTPLDERKDEKKYFVRAFGETLNINDLGTAMLLFENKFKTKFTDEEIEQLKQRDDIPLDWDKVKFEEADEY